MKYSKHAMNKQFECKFSTRCLHMTPILTVLSNFSVRSAVFAESYENVISLVLKKR